MKLDTRQIRNLLLLLAAVVAVLSLLWFSLIRTEYVVVYENIRESDASAIVAELERSDISYRLENGGHDILVPEERAADAKVAVAGSGASLGGTVGFELFNDSDMGLTEFAQKINFQRAMQGELSRTIMMMEGIEFARVHLAIPERSIFRASQGNPTAAVTIEMQPGSTLTQQRIGGIQQLIASSVPGLMTYDVAVLDENGDLVSQAASTVAGQVQPATEQAALEGFYAAKARSAIGRVLPGMPFEVEISARQSDLSSDSDTSSEQSVMAERNVPGRDNIALRVLVRTPHNLAKEERDAIEFALIDGLGLAGGRGDVLAFTTGALGQNLATPTVHGAEPTKSAQTPQASGFMTDWGEDLLQSLLSRWTLIGLIILAIAVYTAWPRRNLAAEEAASFAELLKSGLSQTGSSLDA